MGGDFGKIGRVLPFLLLPGIHWFIIFTTFLTTTLNPVRVHMFYLSRDYVLGAVTSVGGSVVPNHNYFPLNTSMCWRNQDDIFLAPSSFCLHKEGLVSLFQFFGISQMFLGFEFIILNTLDLVYGGSKSGLRQLFPPEVSDEPIKHRPSSSSGILVFFFRIMNFGAIKGLSVMFVNITRIKSFDRSQEFFTSSVGITFSIVRRKTRNKMTGVQVNGISSFSSCESDQKSYIKDQSSSSNVQSTPDIEKKYVHCVYDAIAPHFSSTRYAKWPKVATFLNSLPRGSIILDAGCGNGKYLGLNPDCFYIGCDISSSLISICEGKGHEVMVADAVNLPYRAGFGDAAISIAVLHHLSTEDRRRKAINELVRTVRKGGLVLITVWAVEQENKSLLTKWTPLTPKYVEEWVGPSSPRVRCSSSSTLKSIPETLNNSFTNQLKDEENCIDKMEDNSVTLGISSGAANQQEYFVPWHLPYHRAEVSGDSACALSNGLAKKDDKKGAVVYNRYYHVFAEGELERLVSGTEDTVIVNRFYDKSNWCIILEKT
ncbi:hypothetical protein GIB67_026098 [Kingdonia uniflora]|uniref:Methyltransferase type 11 domain-containing protein n=1 Tax=Kingdonia uniflora TaxID=39325 RepID=A0A7J7M319_9MAGN|nr:hypothetical protein GIB67_026098 [Kingdonia uniflora]